MIPSEQEAAIGIFDSGVGGLTVFREVAQRLPRESILYLGDTARVPYGTKSADTVVRYAHGCARILQERNIKLLVVACNTASAVAVEQLRDTLDIPVIGVIEPGALAAVKKTRNGHIGVIGTAGTIASGAYSRYITARMPDATIVRKACPLFVPLAEEGWVEGTVPEQVAEAYLSDLLKSDMDTLVLGCTHYPLLKTVIAKTVGNAVTLVDSAEETALVVAESLALAGLTAPEYARPLHQFLSSDDPEAFVRAGRSFLGHDLTPVEWVDF